MAEIDERISEWQAAGVIDVPTASRIRDFERERANKPAAAEAEGGAPRPTVIEAVVYLGLVVIAAGVLFLIAENWSEFESWARVAICAVPLAALLLLGFAFGTSDHPGLKRGAQLAWFVSVGLLVVTLAVLFEEFGGNDRFDDGRTELLLISLATFGFATILWAVAASELQVTAVAGSLFFVVMAMANHADEFSQELAGVLGLVFGFAALALVERRLLRPLVRARIVFAVFIVASTYVASFETRWWFESLCFIGSIGLLATGIARNSFALVVWGIVGTFLALVTFVFAHFENDLGAPFALIISGALVLFGVMLVVQARSITRMRTRMREGLI